jgi:hypothetical protein
MMPDTAPAPVGKLSTAADGLQIGSFIAILTQTSNPYVLVPAGIGLVVYAVSRYLLPAIKEFRS